MRIGNVIIDTDNMTYNEVDQLVQELRAIRKRKSEASACRHRMKDAVEQSKEYGFRYVNRYTGEIFNADDWWVYDEEQNRIHGDEVEK
jgi:hypothetical protein